MERGLGGFAEGGAERAEEGVRGVGVVGCGPMNLGHRTAEGGCPHMSQGRRINKGQSEKSDWPFSFWRGDFCALRIRRRGQQLTMLDALYRVGLDGGFLVAANIDVGEDQEGLRAVGYVEGAVEAHGLDATFLAAGLVEGFGEGHGLVVDLVGKMRWQQSDRQRDGRLDLHAEFLAVVVWSHQAVDLGCRRDLVFFVEDAAPVELRLNAIEVLDVEIVGRNELPHSGSEDGADGGDDGPLGPALIAEGDDHRAFGGKMALVDRAGDMLLHAEEVEICRGSGPHGGVPFVGPGHGHGDRVSGVDLHVHVSAPDSGIVHAAGVKAGGFQRDVLAVGSGPDNLILRMRVRGQGAEQQRGENGKIPHPRSIGRVQARTLADSRGEDYEGTKCPWRERMAGA